MKIAYKQRGGNPLFQMVVFACGIVSAILSLLWVIHIIAYVFVFPPTTTFLNGYFVMLDNVFPLFGTITYAIFAVYLLCCVVKGNIKFGGRATRPGAGARPDDRARPGKGPGARGDGGLGRTHYLRCVRCLGAEPRSPRRFRLACPGRRAGLRIFFFQIHPMRIGNTMMNSLLFNTELILVCSVAVVHFCQRAFDIYTRLTTIDQILGNEVENLKFLKYFFQNSVFLWVLILLALLSFVWLLIFPKEKKQEKFDDDDVSVAPRIARQGARVHSANCAPGCATRCACVFVSRVASYSR